MNGGHIFISYSHKDEQYVRDVARRMRDAGLEPWYFTESQRAGVSWAQRLYDVISQARAVLVIISSASNSPEAEYVLAEVMLAQRERRQIIPLKIHESLGPLDAVLAARNWINVWDGSDPLPKILAAVAAHSGVPNLTAVEDMAQLAVEPIYRQQVNLATFTLALPASAALVEQGSPLTLCRIGRDPRGDLVFAGSLAFVSRQHARIYAQIGPDGATYFLADERSRHGVFVNGARLAAQHTLVDGDQIGLGVPFSMLTFRRISVTSEAPSG